MHGHRPVHVDLQPTLGHQGTIGVHYVQAGAAAAQVPEDCAIPPGVAPDAAPEIVTRLDQILVEFQQLTQAVYLNTPVADHVVRQALERIACTAEELTAIGHDVHSELVKLRADLHSRTAAARLRRAWAWLKGLFV